MDNGQIVADNGYLKLIEISQEALLTAEQEIKLAKLKDAGDKAARDRLITANMRLVAKHAGRFNGLTFADRFQAGCEGLMRAVEMYDWTLGFRFSTYATAWIIQAITRQISMQGRTVRLPVHIGDKLAKLYRIISQIEAATGDKATIEEIALEADMKPEQVEDILRVGQPAVSLDEDFSGECDGNPFNMASIFVDEDSESVEVPTEHKQLQETFDDILMTLSPREADVLKRRNGFNGYEPHTLQDVADRYALTRERIRQIEKAALRKLRHPRRARRLKDFLE